MRDNRNIIDELIKYIPRVILDRLEKNPLPIKKPFSEKYYCSFLFADIVEFSTLTEKVVSQQDRGLEMIANILSTYLEQLIRIIINANGDIVKFAGDALFVMWKVEEWSEEKLAQATYTAALCGLEIQKRLFQFPIYEQIRLSVRVGVSTGTVYTMHVGGAFQRWEYVITGDALNLAAKAQKTAKPGEVGIAKRSWKLLEKYGYGRRDGKTFKLLVPEPEKKLAILDQDAYREYKFSKNVFPIIRNYVPRAIITRIEQGYDSWHYDFMVVSILFIKVGSSNMKALSDIDKVQEIMEVVQRCIYTYEGSINRFGVDDKGVVILTAFGLPPLIHVDDAERALKAALMVKSELRKIGYDSRMGIATGKVFTGTVGNEIRSEYTMHGTNVNFAARLMQVSTDIVCDEITYSLTKDKFEFEVQLPRKFKGKLHLVTYYRVLGEKK